MNKLKELRALKGWSQTELAEKAGVKQANISSIELGKSTGYSVRTMKLLADALGITVLDIEEFAAKIRDEESQRVASVETYYPEPDELAEIQEAIKESEAEKARGFRITHEEITRRIADRIANYKLQKERASA